MTGKVYGQILKWKRFRMSRPFFLEKVIFGGVYMKAMN